MNSIPAKIRIEILTRMDYNLGYWIRSFYSEKKRSVEMDLTAIRIITTVECMKTIDNNIPWASDMYAALYPDIFV